MHRSSLPVHQGDDRLAPDRRPYVLSGRRPKPDVSNLSVGRRMRLYRCRLDIRACHPASRIWRPSSTGWGYYAPLPGFHEEHRDIARFGGEDKSKDAVRLANALWQTAY